MRRREEERRKKEDRENARKAKRVIKEAKKRQRHIDVEAPILDFELKEPTPEPEPESEEEEDNTEAPAPAAAAINLTAARSKIDLGRAKKRAAERAKGPKHADASTGTDSAFTEIELIVAEKLHRREKFSDKVMQTQWEISNADYEFSRLSDNEKADMMTKQISKMKSKHVTKLLKSIDSGVLDISLPMLVPFLSLQARMSLGTDLQKNRFKQEDAAGKNKMVKETFVDTMLKDITDIALLQEIIERSQEKLQILAAEDEKRFAEKMRKQMINIENDSFELGSSPPVRAASPVIEQSCTPVRSVKEISPEIQVSHESVKEESGGETTSGVANKNSPVRKSASGKEGEDGVPFGISDVLSDEEEEEEGVCDVKEKKSEAKKSDDEGCGSSESDDDKEETKKAQSKAEESDEGIGKSDDNVSKDEEEAKVEEAPKENNIKNKILNIIQDAKAMDQKRNIRNYGRNFEFQGVKEALKPVLPNDRRPTKAKRLDCMWTNVTAAKQRYNDPPAPSLEELKSKQKKAAPTLEELKNKPKSSVPWTRKSNAQPVKKEILGEEKEVKEFESCRRTLKDNVKIEAAEKDTRKIQAVKKNETTAQMGAPVVKENNEEVEIESDKSCKKEKIADNEEKTQINDVEVVEIENESSEKVPDTDITEKASCSAESAKTEAEETKVKVEESDSKVKVSELETAALPRRSVSPSNNCASESSSEVEWELSEDEEAVVHSKATSPVKERSPVAEKPLSKAEPVIATKEIPSLLLMSPMLRRRGETSVSDSNCVSVSASIRLPPPPSFRPPPPPVSPPVPATKVKDLANERSLGLVKKDESSEEEESEWEYETESEEE